MSVLTRRRAFGFTLLAFAVVAMGPSCANSETTAETGRSGERTLHVRQLVSPASDGSRLPRFAQGPHGGLVMSWVEESETDLNPTARWCFATWDGEAFSEPHQIAEGQDWFLNWVDLPGLQWLGGTQWAGHYLQRSSTETYDYHVRVVRSADDGRNWSAPVTLHVDEGPGEHGFVAWTSVGEGRALAGWLDGRGVVASTGEGATALYTRTVKADGELGPEVCVDDRVCDCCPTAAASLDDGSILVAYRDRGSDELRDISIVRLREGEAPQSIWSSRDGWTIAGCPVNGPALAVTGNLVGVAWFTMGADAHARVLAALSADGGRSFAAPQLIAQGPVQGRVDAVFDSDGRLVVTWLQATSENSTWCLALLDRDGGLLASEIVVFNPSSSDAGLARLARSGDSLLFAYTEHGDSPRVLVDELWW